MNDRPASDPKAAIPRGEEDPFSPLLPELPLPAFLGALDGRILSWNGPFGELLEIPGSIQAPHLVRQNLLDHPLSFLGEIREGRAQGKTRSLRMRTLSGRPLHILAHISSRPGPGGEPLFLALLMDAAPWDRSERALRAEIHRLEDLLERTAGKGLEGEVPWKDAARGLLACFPHKAVLLDRRLRVLLPTQGTDGPPVLCAEHLLGSPGACPECLAEKALAENREVRLVLEGKRLAARPLPGGLVLEWLEEETETETEKGREGEPGRP